MHDLSNSSDSDLKTASILREKLATNASKVVQLNQQLSLYRKEEKNCSRELEKLQLNDGDASDIEEAEKKLFNAGQMLPGAQSRLATAMNDLRVLIRKGVEYLPSDDEAMGRALEASRMVDL